MEITGHLTSAEKKKFRSILNSTLLNVGVIVDNSNDGAGPLTQLKIWELKGLATITEIEDFYDFDFVTVDDCNLVVSDGQFVIIRR